MRELTDVLTAIAHPMRRAIIRRLAAEGRMRFTDIAKPLQVNLNAVTKHLQMLDRAGLILREKEGREVYISLRARPLKMVEKYVHEYERFWNERLVEFEQHFSNRKIVRKSKKK